MNLPSLPTELSPTYWERQAGPLAKAKPATLADELRALERSFGALDFSLLDVARLAGVEEAEQRATRLDGEFDKGMRALLDRTRAVEAAAAKVDNQLRKDSNAKPALQAAAAIARAAVTQRGELAKSLDTAKAAVARRLDELRQAALKAAEKTEPESPERRRLTTRVIDQFRIVKNRPDRTVVFLLCVGRETAAPYLGPTASDSQKPLLTKALKGDTGFKFYRGECIWEEGSYTFVGRNLSSTLARRIERGIADLTGTRYRVRARDK
jgi:hypothetical protein